MALGSVLIGAGLVFLGQGLTHRYTVQRELRRERADAEVELRQARFSMRIRLPADHVLPNLFESAE